MRKVISFYIIIILLLVVGCSNNVGIKHNYTYKGENDFWTAEYKVDGTDAFTKKGSKNSTQSRSNTTFTITYKKNLAELSSIKHMEISYESSVNSQKITNNFNKNNKLNKKTYILKSDSKGTAIEGKDETIKATINLDGKIQTIELKSVQWFLLTAVIEYISFSWNCYEVEIIINSDLH